MDDKNRILLVDDDPGLLRLLSIRLSAVGYEVEAIESGELALKVLPVFRPHLIITDMKMGGMDGMTLFKHVRDRDPSIPVMILTAHGTIPDAVEAVRRGVTGYMTKPFNSKILLEQVAQALNADIPACKPGEQPVVNSLQ